MGGNYLVDQYGDSIANTNPLPIKVVGDAALSHAFANIETTTTVAALAAANRKYLLLINDSDTPIYVSIGQNAVLNRGIRINANGGSFEMSAALGNLDTRAVNAIHGSTGTKVLLIMEG